MGKIVSLSSINQNRIYNNNINSMATKPIERNNVIPPISSERKPAQIPSFGAGQNVPALNVRTELTTKEEQAKYMSIISNIDRESRKNLELLLKSGILLNNNSNDKSTTLDNLHKILTTPRAAGLTPATILKETVNTIANPFTITQKFGNIPKSYLSEISQKARPNPKTPNDVINEQTIKVNSSNCVAASIEFNLASQTPAEFARFAEGLTSPRMAVDKKINLNNLADNLLDSVYLLNIFEIPYKMSDFNTAKLTLAPDKNATIRAQIQNFDKDYLERSLVDVLMQSTFMNIGSQQTYDSLTDIRGGDFSMQNTGLVEFEKTFAESVVQDKNKISMVYQILDENGKITGYNTDFETMKKQILDSLSIGESVIIGYTYTLKNSELPTPDPNKKPDEEILTGHEITIIGAAKDKNGKLIFICNDTDDDKSAPVLYPEDYLLPKIHHAGLPQKIAVKYSQFNEPWVESLNAYKEAKNKK